ncbi:MAG: 3-phosphoshikimate 1-carboxyvinyltransferase [Clostridia bacterium]|nr:3-phosphoshikimate 1-carboxyvinyltransferase [Clostridia bacterium]
MKVEIKPCRARGTVGAPPSKSFAHRQLICAALAGGGSVNGVIGSGDMKATLNCVEAAGTAVRRENNTVFIENSPAEIPAGAVFDCLESGSTLRFFIPVVLAKGADVLFTGSSRLIERGAGAYERLLSEKGAEIRKTQDGIYAKGRLESGEYEIPGSESSQYTSGLLFALPLLEGDSVLRVLPPVNSRPYIDITLEVLKSRGIEIFEKEENTFYIKGGQTYRAVDSPVEGDWSNAAFLLALNALGGDVTVTGLNENSAQGDRFCVEAFAMLENKSPVIDLSACPDLAPVLFAVAAAKNGAVFTGTKRLKIKESDRAEAMAEELGKFGVKCEIYADSVKVGSGLKTPCAQLNGHNDHRVVMALSVLATLTGGVIEGAQAVNKSYPAFFEDLKALSAEVKIDA